jgi:hypothetical protein
MDTYLTVWKHLFPLPRPSIHPGTDFSTAFTWTLHYTISSYLTNSGKSEYMLERLLNKWLDGEGIDLFLTASLIKIHVIGIYGQLLHPQSIRSSSSLALQWAYKRVKKNLRRKNLLTAFNCSRYQVQEGRSAFSRHLVKSN